MPIKKPLPSFLLCCLVLAGSSSRGQDHTRVQDQAGGTARGRNQAQASPGQRLSGLLTQYREHRLGDTAYLKAVDSIAPRVLDNDSLPQWLSAYREVAFSDKRWGAYRASYYTYLAIYSYNKNQFGSAIYYSEKNNEEKIKVGLFEKGGLAHSDVFAITVYSNNRDYARVLSRYDSLRPALLRLPAAISAGTVSTEQTSLAFMVLNAVVYAASKAKDSARAAQGVRIGEKMLAAIRQSPEKYKGHLLQYTYHSHLSGFENEKFLAHFDTANRLLQEAIREVTTKGFPPNLQPAYTEFSYTEAFDFYFDNGKIDSARHYLDLVKTLSEKGVSYSNLDPVFLPESNSKLQARNGHFEAAYKALLEVYRTRDSAFYSVSSDKDNNLYALAEAENTRAELVRTEGEQRRTEAARLKAERFTQYLFTLLALLIMGGFAGFLFYRSRQRQRLLNLQLNLARNFHDEIGPMLLYANALVKKEMETRLSAGADMPSSPRLEELKTQTMQIMEAVRGISHDLKSDRLSTVDSFYKEVAALLEKIRRTTQIDFNIRLNNGSRILSYWQYTHLKKMVNELIGNSIKHAGCSRITIGIKAMERDLSISYSDDGKGMAPGSPAGGIGIRNVQERAALLKGSFQLHNAWPEGYSIELSIPLV
jgi:signal transduction histidine kinase